MRIRTLKQLVFVAVIYMFIAVTIHEYGHLLSLKAMGIEGVISTKMIDAVTPERVLGRTEALVFSASGGLFTLLVFGVMRLLESDREDQGIQSAILWRELVYVFFEVYAYTVDRRFYVWGSWVALVAVLGYLIYFIVWCIGYARMY